MRILTPQREIIRPNPGIIVPNFRDEDYDRYAPKRPLIPYQPYPLIRKQAAVAYVNSSSNTSATTSVVVTTSGGAVPDGYHMVAMGNTGSSGTANIAPPAGWSTHDTRTLANAWRVGLFSKRASGEGATQTFTCADSTLLEVHIMWFSGVDASVPLDTVTPAVSVGTDATIEFADVTSVTNNAMSVLFAMESAFYPTMPVSYNSGGHSANTISGAYLIKATAGLISGLTGDGFSNWCAYSMVLRESGAGGGGNTVQCPFL